MHDNLQSILVGTSLREGSDPVVRAAAELAGRTGAALYLVHAHTLPLSYFEVPAASSGALAISTDLLETERQVRRQMLDEQLTRLGIANEDVADAVIAEGAAHHQVLETAALLKADLLVLGAHETRGIHLLGSTCDRVLRKASVPVWVVPGEGSRIPPRHMLAPVDLSPLSSECLRRGLEIVEQIFGHAGLDATDLETLFVLTTEELASSTQFSPEQVQRMAHEELDRFVDKLPAPADPILRGDRLRCKVRTGEIRQEILDEIDELEADLVVLGTHGRSGFERFLLGSVASDIAGRAPCNVLVIPPRRVFEEAHDRAPARQGNEDFPELAAMA